MSKIYTCFPKGRTLAFTCSYDDGKVMDRRLVELMNHYGIKSTFHLNSEYLGAVQGHRYPYITKEEVKQLYEGHEVACHSSTHITMTRSNCIQNLQEVLKDRETLETLCEVPVIGYSYPNGCFNEDVVNQLKACGIQYARTTKQTKAFALPDDFMKWHPTAHHNEDIFALKDRFLSVHYGERLNVFYLWGHSYEFDRDNSWERIRDFFKQMSGHFNVWYVTNGELYQYMTAANHLIYFCDQKGVYNPSAIDIWIRVDDDIVKVGKGEMIRFSF